MSRRVNPFLKLALIASLVLSGCARGDDDAPLELQIVVAARTAFKARKATKTPELTRAVLDTVEGSLLEVTLERRDQRAYLYVEAARRDTSPGEIVVWRTGDDVSLAMRNGVLFATRGLGGDILSGAVQVTGDTPGPARGGEKSLDIRAHDNKALHLTLACDVADLGRETITIIGHSHTTRHLRETCEGGRDSTGETGRVVNDYWTGTGVVWQSRQWAGPGVGYLNIRRVTK